MYFNKKANCTVGSLSIGKWCFCLFLRTVNTCWHMCAVMKFCGLSCGVYGMSQRNVLFSTASVRVAKLSCFGGLFSHCLKCSLWIKLWLLLEGWNDITELFKSVICSWTCSLIRILANKDLSIHYSTWSSEQHHLFIYMCSLRRTQILMFHFCVPTRCSWTVSFDLTLWLN